MQYTILCVGKIKEKFYQDAIKEYVKRMSRYAKVDIVEVADEKTVENASINLENQIKEKEGDRLLRAIKDSMYVVALAIEGKEADSVEFSKYLSKKMTEGKSHIAFVIGGSLGLSKDVLNRADDKISFSKMTFPHQLMRVILLEQVYRAQRIMNNEPYHK